MLIGGEFFCRKTLRFSGKAVKRCRKSYEASSAAGLRDIPGGPLCVEKHKIGSVNHGGLLV